MTSHFTSQAFKLVLAGAAGFALMTGSAVAMDPSNSQGQAAQKQMQMQQKKLQMSPDAGSQAAQYSPDQIKAFAKTAAKVQQIQSDHMPKFKKMQDKADKKQMYETMQKKMMDAVKSTDNINMQTYNQIAADARNNPQLAQRIRKQMKQM